MVVTVVTVVTAHEETEDFCAASLADDEERLAPGVALNFILCEATTRGRLSEGGLARIDQPTLLDERQLNDRLPHKPLAVHVHFKGARVQVRERRGRRDHELR